MEVPRQWTQIRPEHLEGLLLIIGGPDTGKSTLARYLYERLAVHHSPVCYIDGDPGQSTLGLPTTIGFAMGREDDATFPPAGDQRRYFIGDVSPRGHMLSLLAGARRLADEAFEQGAETAIYDTCGLVDAELGGHALKLALIDLLQPAVVLTLQRNFELETLLLPLRLSGRTRVIDLPASPFVVRRDVSDRRANRAGLFARYFRQAAPLELGWARRAVFPRPAFRPDQVVALEDIDGFTAGLGIVVENRLSERTVTFLTPLKSVDSVMALRLGDLLLDRQTYQDRRM